MKKKICLIAPSNSIHTIKHIDILKKCHYDIYYIALRDEWHPIKNTTFINLIENIPYKLALFYAWMRIHKRIKKINPDLIHVHYLTPFGLFVLNTKAKKIISFWGSDIRISYKNSTLFMKYLYNRAIKSSDYILIPGNYLLEYIPYKIEKVKETIWGIDIKSLGEKNDDEKAKWDFKDNEIIITSIRVNRRIFQIERIIDAVSELERKGNKVHLNLIEGSYNNYNAEIRNYTKGKEFIQFHNLLNNSEYHSLLRASDIGLSLATTDAGPVSVKESMAIGLPIIFQDIFGINRTIQNNITGIGLSDLSIESLEEYLHSLIYNRELYEKISKNAKIYAMKNFDQKKYEQALKTIYGLLLK